MALFCSKSPFLGNVRGGGGGGGGGSSTAEWSSIQYTEATHCVSILFCVWGTNTASDFIEYKNRHFNVNSSKELFEEVPPDSILNNLHDIGLLY